MGNKLKYTLDTIHVVSDHIKDLINNYTIFLFNGDMGSGKTTLIKQIVKDIGISENVKSPTFSLVNEYIENDLIIFHFDLYRINKENELDSIGFYEYLNSGKLCFIEWPDIAIQNIYKDYVLIKISITSDSEREIEILKS
ncbi:MAG: tRNA (adenosine(37)-N6)-threonylcarbamoyltransferase complex ATPase subunit type 1 TsaE [Flavobacteriaceae bacterium]|nr:tRNA (adenosine(37)-N6)-threonylcarbamoyltransferase complex ATPase subunit type 1 TsaE [Flavobacteriaceae bacterium]